MTKKILDVVPPVFEFRIDWYKTLYLFSVWQDGKTLIRMHRFLPCCTILVRTYITGTYDTQVLPGVGTITGIRNYGYMYVWALSALRSVDSNGIL